MDEAEVFLWELQRGELEATENNSDTVPSGERPCPICGTHMAVENISGSTTNEVRGVTCVRV